MAEKIYRVEVQEDHLERLANARPIQAVAELIWNSLDADARRVDVEVYSTDIGMQSISIRDNGHGIPYEDAPNLFGKLGGSWKARSTRSRTKNRMLHGKEGKGRFKALALGRVADWDIKYCQGGGFFHYTISLIRDDLIDVRITDNQEIKNCEAGVEVKITELHHDFRSLIEDSAIQELSEIFAIYLTDYSDIMISYRDFPLDPASVIVSRKKIKLDPIKADGAAYKADLEIIEWKTATERVVYLCSENGFPFQRLIPRLHAPGFQYSAYLKSPYITKLYEAGQLDLAEMDSALVKAYEAAQEQIKTYFRDREGETAKSQIEQWKVDKIYPYPEDPQNSVEEVERKVFDIVALNVNHHLPDFSSSDLRSKAFQLRMLRQSIERGPEELQLILSEVLGLPPRKQRELAKLLKETTLSNIISASRLVADRLKFLRGLEAILFDNDLKKHLKERSQLHRLLAENTWIFGEEFNLTVDDQSLTEVLHKHLKAEGREFAFVDNRPVTKIDGAKGIIDLMVSRLVPRNHPDEREHLVVELKAPIVKIGDKEITQIKKYAFGVIKDARFVSLKSTWNFWVLSNELDSFAKQETRQKDRPRGLIHQSDDGQTKIWVKTWAEIIQECEARLSFVKEKLALNIDKASSLKFLYETYEKYLSPLKEVIYDENILIVKKAPEGETPDKFLPIRP